MRVPAAAFLCCFLVLSAGCRRKQPPAAAGQPAAPMIYELPVGDRTYEDRLLRGFYESVGAWRWTARRFAVSLDAPPPLEARTLLELDFTVPSELLNEARTVTLTASVNGKQVGKRTYAKTGRYEILLEVPQSLLRQTPAQVEFELDKAVKDPSNGR